MKRKKIVSADADLEVKITIECNSVNGRLMRHEVDRAVNSVASKAMVALTEAPYLGATLATIKVA